VVEISGVRLATVLNTRDRYRDIYVTSPYDRVRDMEDVGAAAAKALAHDQTGEIFFGWARPAVGRAPAAAVLQLRHPVDRDDGEELCARILTPYFESVRAQFGLPFLVKCRFEKRAPTSEADKSDDSPGGSQLVISPARDRVRPSDTVLTLTLDEPGRVITRFKEAGHSIRLGGATAEQRTWRSAVWRPLTTMQPDFGSSKPYLVCTDSGVPNSYMEGYGLVSTLALRPGPSLEVAAPSSNGLQLLFFDPCLAPLTFEAEHTLVLHFVIRRGKKTR
jgi:hypothetical protein